MVPSKNPRSNPALPFAARIKAAVGLHKAKLEAEAEARRARNKRIAEEVARLLDNLEEMGRAAEVLRVERSPLEVKLLLEDRSVAIRSTPEDERPDHLDIEATGVEQSLSAYWEDEIERWALRIEEPPEEGDDPPPPRSRVLALLGMGMTWLIQRGLGLPLQAPDESEEG